MNKIEMTEINNEHETLGFFCKGFVDKEEFVNPLFDESIDYQELKKILSNSDFFRVLNIPGLKTWIKKNIPENNQQRLIKLLEDMDQDQNLFLWISF